MTAAEVSFEALIVEGRRGLKSLADIVVAQNLPRACRFVGAPLIEGSLADAGQIYFSATSILQGATDAISMAIEATVPLPQTLRDETRLSIDILATLTRVSRQRFHQWLRGEGISPENEERLSALLHTMRAISALRSAAPAP